MHDTPLFSLFPFSKKRKKRKIQLFSPSPIFSLSLSTLVFSIMDIKEWLRKDLSRERTEKQRERHSQESPGDSQPAHLPEEKKTKERHKEERNLTVLHMCVHVCVRWKTAQWNWSHWCMRHCAEACSQRYEPIILLLHLTALHRLL